MSQAITTRSYDNARTGSDVHEQVLTPAAVGTRGIKLSFSMAMTGDLRGIEAQPLAVPGIELADGSVHDVIYLADMANQVWAFDAATGQQLWMTKLGTPIQGSKDIDSHLINDHWGVLGTPVIDTQSGVMYVVAWTSPDGTAAAGQHGCYAISIRNGQQVHPPVNLENATYDAGHGTQPQIFKSAQRKQRAGLLLTKVKGVATIFIGFGSIRETDESARGWVIACSTEPFAQAAAWSSTCQGFGGGIWHGAGGLAADHAGEIYAMTGNGTFDGVTDFSESFVRLHYTPPPTVGQSGNLIVVDWWTPFTDDARQPPQAGADADDLPEHLAAPTNFRAYAAGMMGWDDMDLASGGPVLVPSHHAVLGAGKDGVLYVVDQNAMGKSSPADVAAGTPNYAKLLSPPILFTYYAADINPAPADITELNKFAGNLTHHLHGNPVYWSTSERGPMVFCWGENGNLRAWTLNEDASLTYLACSAETASPDSPAFYGGMPGGMISLSAHQGVPHTGIVWAAVPYEDGNVVVGPGRLLAYDATQFGQFGDGSARMTVLWDSQDWNIQFSFNKFNRPITFKGRLYVPTYDDRVDVYELA